jgi:hypothetical protein
MFLACGTCENNHFLKQKRRVMTPTIVALIDNKGKELKGQ